MANQIKGKYVKNDAIGGSKILMLNDEPLRALRADGSQESLFKLNSLDQLLLLKMPRVSSDAVDGSELVRKSQTDSLIAAEAAARDAAIAAEAAARDAADLAKLQEAKDHADAAVLVEKNRAEAAEAGLQSSINTEKGRIDAILDAADADKDTFAEIVQLINSVDLTNDNALAAAVLGLQSDIDAEELARIAGDASTLASAQAYADSVVGASNIAIGQVKFVAKSGSDSTGTGSVNKPYASLTAALNSITDASPSKRYVVRVASGSYTEASVALPANVFVIGENKESVRITGAVSMGSWAQDNSGSDDRSGFSMVTLLSAANFNWTTAKSRAGKLYMNEVVFGSTLNMYGYDNAIAQAQFDSCVMFGAVTISGINVGVFSNNSCLGNMTLNQHPNGGMATILNATGGQCNGTVTLNATVNDFNRRCSLFAKNHYMEYVTVNGPSAYADMNEGSLPRSRDRISATNGGNVVYITTKAPHVTNTVNIGEPGYQYLYNFSYVHGSTDTDLYVVSMGSAYSAANTGRSIFIESDTYGLNPDVNGGNINLVTAATSGTGVRGKIKLDAKEVDVSDKKITNLANGSDPNDAVNKSQLDSAVSSEASSRASADTALQANIDAEKARIDAILSAADADKDSFAEIVALINSVDLTNDNSLASAITSLQGNIDAEASARAAADTALQGNIDAEASARAAAVGAVQAEVDAEEVARAAADAAIQSDVDALDSYAQDIRTDVDALDSYAQDIRSDLDALQLQVNSLDANQLESLNETFVLSASDILNGYVDLAVNSILANSAVMFIGRLGFFEGDDFSVGSAPSGKVRISFSAALMASAEAPEAGDILRLKYLVQ